MKRLLPLLSLIFILASTPVLSAGLISEQIATSLVKLDGKKAKKHEDPAIADKKIFALYFSAHWCPPCRAFTPKLVEFYNRVKNDNPQFELIFISRDQSAEDMESYMNVASMPWPAIRFASIQAKKGILDYMGRGIPCLVVVDAQGKILSDTNVNGEYRGPTVVMQELEKILKDHKP